MVWFLLTQHLDLESCQERHFIYIDHFSFSADDNCDENRVEFVTYEENPRKLSKILEDSKSKNKDVCYKWKDVFC